MDINEAFRRIVAGHLRLITGFLLIPVLAVVALAGTSGHGYIASARIQAATTSIGSETEADALLNRVVGVATSTTIVDQALHTAKIANRSAADVAREVTVSRLGASTVMNISVTDPDPRFASALASSLATTVVSFIGAQGTPQQHDLVNRLTAEQKQLYDQRVQLVAALSQATGAVTIANLSPLAAVDQQLNDVGSTLRQLQVAMATGSSASVISLADPAKAVPSGITTELVLVGIAGLIAGLLTASIVEVVRPRVADAHAFARELGVPMLGTLSARREVHGLRRWLSPRRRGSSPAPTGEGPPLLAGAVEDRTIVALRVAAVRLKAQTLAVIDETDRPCSTVLADGLTARLRALSPAMVGEDGNAPTVDSIGVSATIFERSATTALSPVNQGRRTHAAEPSVRVVPMSAITEAPAFGGCALLVLVPKLTRYSYLRRVADLASATGWPVVGVLGTPARASRGQS